MLERAPAGEERRTILQALGLTRDSAAVPAVAFNPDAINASRNNVNWVYPGWLRTLSDAGFRVIALDNRGHGDSEWVSDGNYRTMDLVYDVAQLIHQLDLAREFADRIVALQGGRIIFDGAPGYLGGADLQLIYDRAVRPRSGIAGTHLRKAG